MVVIFLFFAFLRRQEARRREEFIGQLPELARVLSNASAAGLVMRTAIEMAAEELDDPASTELRRTADALRLGQSTEQALHELGERLPSRELAVLVSTLIVSARSGGSLVTALRSIASTLEERKEIRREVKTIMGEAVVTNWAIAIMGVGILLRRQPRLARSPAHDERASARPGDPRRQLRDLHPQFDHHSAHHPNRHVRLRWKSS